MSADVPACVKRARDRVPRADAIWQQCGGDEWFFCRVAARWVFAGDKEANALLNERAHARGNCPHCSGVACVAVKMVQARSADEGETARHVCSLCRKRWSA